MWPLLQQKSNKYYIFWERVCSLWYPACNVHAPYRHLWPAQLYNIFHIILSIAQFKKKKVCVLIFCTTFVWNISHSKKNWARCWKIYIGLYVKQCYSCHILMKLEFLDRFLKNTQKSNFTKIRPVGAKLYHADRTDSHDEANICFSQYCECT